MKDGAWDFIGGLKDELTATLAVYDQSGEGQPVPEGRGANRVEDNDNLGGGQSKGHD